MRRIAILVAVLAALLLGGLGLIVARALESVKSEQAMRHSVLAERVFDELEEELTALIDREESRPFLQYRFFYVPEGQLPGNAPALSRSPLSEVPEEDWLLGWFQVDPGGDVSTPLQPKNFELASTVGWSEDAWIADRSERVRSAAEALPFKPPPPPARDLLASKLSQSGEKKPDPVPATISIGTSTKAKTQPKLEPAPEPTPSDDGYVAVDAPIPEATGRKKKLDQGGSTYDTSISSLNKGAVSRSGRQQRVTKSRADNLGSFQNPDEYNSAWLQQGGGLPEVGFDSNAEDAVADTVEESYRDGQADDGEDDESLLGRFLGNGRRSADVADEERPVEQPPPADQQDGVESLDDALAEGELQEVGAANEEADEVFAALDADGDADYAPEQDGRRRKSAKKKNRAPAAQPAGQPEARERELAVATESDAPMEFRTGEEAAEREEEKEEATEKSKDAEAPAPPEETAPASQIALVVPAPAAGPDRAEDKNAASAAVATTGAELAAPSMDPEPPTVVVASAPVAKDPPRKQQRKEEPKQQAQFPLPQGAEEVDVEISPLRGHRADADTLLLYRTVRIGEAEYVQGLALLLPALSRWLEKRVLAGAEVGPYLDLVWNVGPADEPSPADFVYAHTFADPFTSLATTAYLRALPEGRRSGRTWILQLTLMLLLVGALGIAALLRMVSVVVHFAERRNNFVAAVSHELKTPLTAIRMYSEMLRDGYVLTEEKRGEYYETMATESERLSRLIQNVLELSRLEKSGTATETTVGKVQPVLDEAIRVLDRHARDKGFSIELDVPDDLPSVRFERDGLLQVLINLVDNAIKFSKETDTKVVVVQARQEGEGVALSIRDHGPGVPQRQLKRIFQPFFRGERELTRRTKGTGIGLALVKGIVERMGGQVTARNHPSGGFEVRVALAGA